MVARTLVSQNRPEEMTAVAERARYCQLMAGKMKLDPVEVSRIILSAWLSALEDNIEMIKPLVDLHNIGDILFPDENKTDNTNLLESQVLSLVRGYQALKNESEAIGKDVHVAQKYLMKAWAVTSEDQSMVRKFVRVLSDENFLTGSDTTVAGGHILIVDPEEAVTPVLSIPLSNHGYQTDVAPDVAAASTIISETPPDLIVSEMEMPLVDGLEFCSQIKNNVETTDIPFIIITSKKGHKVPTRCLKAGADDYLTKPIDLELLFLKVQRFVEVPEKKESEGEPETGVIGSLKDMKFTDMIQILCAGGKSMQINLSHEGEDGTVYIQNGEICHATVGDKEGDPAFYTLMRWHDGTFSTAQCEDFPERSIQSTTMSLLMEGARLVDEGIDL